MRFDDEDVVVPFLSTTDTQPTVVAFHDTFLWRLIHAVGFIIGGTTFIAGTVTLLSSASYAPLLSAVLYIIGSIGFLTIDVLELFTFTDQLSLTLNILTSAVGSTAYIVGSVGFLPIVVSAWGGEMGVWGFLVGSGAIGVSQIVKVGRLLRQRADGTCICVEVGAGLGAVFFLVGTGVLGVADFMVVFVLWLIGSVAFTAGGLCLAFRHFVLHVT